MTVKILYFASLREALGQASENIDLPAQIATIGQLQAHLVARGEAWEALRKTKNLRVAINQQMAAPDAPVQDGDEVAFFPPVTGG